MKQPDYVVGVTGASGSILGIRIIEALLDSGAAVAGIISDAGRKVAAHELPDARHDSSLNGILRTRKRAHSLAAFREYADDDLFAPPASGSSGFRAVVIAPCSMKTLGCVAGGIAESLIGRAADVALKEGRKCVLVPRETPLGLIHLENLVRVKRAGADVVPPMLAFYNRPASLDDAVDFVVGRVLDLLGVEHRLYRRWTELAPAERPARRRRNTGKGKRT